MFDCTCCKCPVIFLIVSCWRLSVVAVAAQGCLGCSQVVPEAQNLLLSRLEGSQTDLHSLTVMRKVVVGKVAMSKLSSGSYFGERHELLLLLSLLQLLRHWPQFLMLCVSKEGFFHSILRIHSGRKLLPTDSLLCKINSVKTYRYRYRSVIISN